ncbi:MAG: hypothetical protein DLM53_11630 [Candidatus Eremiobacter antarcticus]|nr:hypothetical protein [Candidatus Eremiobacteraeota bacterium]MBC5809012.1 hypothetical protein [Candidatus Eremiobacteraeota bacterium]PZR60314.1 MAG: hypothetical protein DLM53_11630 [Candidatus Eremiobacter sp. RRmetagenome_bin22]
MNAPRIINCIIGIWLIYTTILNPWMIAGPKSAWMTLVAGVVLLIFAVLARRDALVHWHCDAVSVLALVLIGHTVVRMFIGMPLVVNTWLVFWIGIIVAVV